MTTTNLPTLSTTILFLEVQMCYFIIVENGILTLFLKIKDKFASILCCFFVVENDIFILFFKK
jgi:hypothetical protein